MTESVRTHAITDVQTDTRSTAGFELKLKTNTLAPESTVLSQLRELNEDTALLEKDLEKYWDAPSSSFRDLDAI